MLEESATRIKCAMIVYELERALGRYVREHGTQLEREDTARAILKRSDEQQTPRTADVTQMIVENSYLGEILALAHVVARGTSDTTHLAEIEKLSTALSLFEIRNAVSHPNRPFPETYWYRCAAIASEPAVDALGFYEVQLALQNAIEGKLVEPPEKWLYKKRWSVPTVLPSEFDHSITGLFGRQKDSAKLEREIRSPRSPLIAIVARGGIGKTSLLLQVVSDLCLSADAPQYFDGVLWASFKQEKLTASGIELLSAPQGLAELETLLCNEGSEIFGLELEDFPKMKAALDQRRLLLCLDNLETLLRDSPHQFEEFYDALPPNWKVVVTSRVPVDNAKNVALDVLERSGSIGFVRAYLATRGVFAPDESLVERIANGAKNNPLAIRLAIELYVSGAEIADALQKTEQEVLAFSFVNLLDRLESLDNDILETVFVMEQPSRSDLCAVLEVTADRASESISKLSKMSFIVRQEVNSRETYALGTSIRDLLRSNPRNLQLRSKVVIWTAKSRAHAQQAVRDQVESGISPVQLSYFPSSAHSSLISVCKQIKAAVKRDDRAMLVTIEAELRHKLESQPSSLLHRLYAWTSLELDDLVTAATHFKKACALDRDDPAPMFGLALTMQAQSNWAELFAATQELIDKGWGAPEKAGAYHASRIWALNLQYLNISENYEKVLELTDNWSASIDVLPSLALGRASAYRRLANSKFKNFQLFNKSQLLELGELLSHSCRLMLKVLVFEGFVKWYLPELRKVLGELQFHRGHGADFLSFTPGDRETIQNLLKYCLSAEAQRAGVVYADVQALLFNLFPPADAAQQIDIVKREELVLSGFVLAKVKAGYKPDSQYFFAQDERGIDYYVRHEVFEQGNVEKRKLLAPGLEVALRFDPFKGGGTAYRSSEAWLVT